MRKIIIFLCIMCLSLFITGCGAEVIQGKSAYDIAVDNGFVGTEEEWLESLKGTDGKDGENLKIVDIYEAAKAEGFNGTLTEFVQQYFKDVDIYGESAYELAVSQGYKGTLEEWLASLQGLPGMDGPQGDSIDLYEVYLQLIELEEINCNFLTFVQDYLHVDLNTSIQPVVSEAIISSVKIVVTNDQLFYSDGSVNPNATGRSGAGVVYKMNKAEGSAYIITNYHVVYDSDSTRKIFNQIYVNFLGNQYISNAVTAKFIGGSSTYDIAILYISGCDAIKNGEVKPVEVADSNMVVAGTTAIAIGNPQGEGIAVTEGIVSVDSETIYMDPIASSSTVNAQGEVEMRVIRIDTPVNPGNSGGGLFNDKGQLIGIVNAKIISSEVTNIGYAIPSNIAKNIADKIIRNYNGYSPATLTKCLIGITITVKSSSAVFNPTTLTTQIIEQIKIVEVSNTSVLYGKVQPEDVIKSITFDGVTYEAIRDFVVLDACLRAEVGMNATIVVLRNGVEYSYNFTFATQTQIG